MCHLQHKLIGFYNRDEKCLKRGMDWVLKYNSLRFDFKWLISRLLYGQIVMLEVSLDRVTPGCLHKVSTAARVWIILQDFESDKNLIFVFFEMAS